MRKSDDHNHDFYSSRRESGYEWADAIALFLAGLLVVGAGVGGACAVAWLIGAW